MQLTTHYTNNSLISAIDNTMLVHGVDTLKWTSSTETKGVGLSALPTPFQPVIVTLRAIAKRIKENSGISYTPIEVANLVTDAGDESAAFTGDDCETFMRALKRVCNGKVSGYYASDDIEQAFMHYLALLAKAGITARDAKGNLVFSDAGRKVAFSNIIEENDNEENDN